LRAGGDIRVREETHLVCSNTSPSKLPETEAHATAAAAPYMLVFSLGGVPARQAGLGRS